MEKTKNVKNRHEKSYKTLFLIVWILFYSISGNPEGFFSEAIAEQGKVLYVSGGNRVSEVDKLFIEEGVEIDVNCMFANASDVQRIILAGIETPDLFVLDVDDGYWGLVQKGYLQEITDVTMVDEVSNFYPAIQRVLMDSSHQIVAMPEYFMPIHWCVNETLWCQVFGEKPYPETFLELAELFVQWNEELSMEYPEVKLLEFYGNSEMLILNAIKQYISQCENAGKPVIFEEEMMIRTLTALRSLNLQTITEAEEDVYFNQLSLILMQPMGGFGVEYVDGCRYVPLLPLRITQDSPVFVPARMRVMFVNPNSRNQELAYAYLRAYWEAQSAKVKAGIIENWYKPVFSRQGVKQLNQIDQDIEKTREALAKAFEERNPDQIDALNMQLTIFNEKKEKLLVEAYDVSQEDIAAYRLIGPFVSLLFGSPYAHDDDHAMQAITQIVRQFVDGKMKPEECARKLSDIAHMVAKENESSDFKQ